MDVFVVWGVEWATTSSWRFNCMMLASSNATISASPRVANSILSLRESRIASRMYLLSVLLSAGACLGVADEDS